LLGAGEEADDAVQEAFVKAFRHLSRFRAGEPFGRWLLRIVANETRNLAGSRRRRAAMALRLPSVDSVGAVRPVLNLHWPGPRAPGVLSRAIMSST
jgi:RNA polymerase sigma-70 factor (ECF subfamily)